MTGNLSLNSIEPRKTNTSNSTLVPPIQPEEREEFTGLEYYEPEEKYRFEVPLVEFDDVDTITVETTQDGKQTYRAIGEFQFTLDGEQRNLTAYEPVDGGELWVPFRDDTSGDTTYGAGRYLDVEEQANGTWVVDFNYAYSPFCAYSEKYECPLVPQSNWLET